MPRFLKILEVCQELKQKSKRNRLGLRSCEAGVMKAEVGMETGTRWPWNLKIQESNAQQDVELTDDAKKLKSRD